MLTKPRYSRLRQPPTSDLLPVQDGADQEKWDGPAHRIAAAATQRRRRVFPLWILLAIVLLGVIEGCGPSKQDMMMRAARRQRPADDEDDQRRPTATKPKPQVTKTAKDPGGKPEQTEDGLAADLVIEAMDSGDGMPSGAGGEVSEVQPEEPEEKTKENQLVSILDRRPSEPLSDDERRKRAYENIRAVGDALTAYFKDHEKFPNTYSRADAGFKGLSWRVELLPYLGYDELHKKFDFSKPWNRPPNDQLLKFIPEEYVSPERFDTKTNLVLPISTSGTFAFLEGEGRGEHWFEDGLANTLILIEANDSAAVQWTQPADLVVSNGGDLQAKVGDQRGDGAYAVWGDGYPVLLAAGLSSSELWKACTAEAGDAQLAAHIHRDITIENVTDESTTTIDPLDTPVPLTNQADTEYKSPTEPVLVRIPVPSASELAAAQNRLRQVYQDDIKDATTLEEKRSLAERFLDTAEELDESDPPGQYTLQSAALSLASSAADSKILVRGVDQRVLRFEVDAYQENLKWLLHFGDESKVPRDQVDGNDYLKRAIRVLYAGAVGDDYQQTANLARHCYRFATDTPDVKTTTLINQVKSSLLTANREFSKARESLATLRKNPDDEAAANDVGMFLCFYKGDWVTGLPLLEQGAPPRLASVVELDLKGADTEAQRIAIGDAWWELGQQARTDLFKEVSMDRASYWYRGALQSMPPSLERIHVEGRLDEFESINVRSPLALIEDLAEDYDVDLSVSLAAITTDQVRSRRRNDDDD